MADTKDGPPSNLPTRKVAYGGLGGALAVVAIALVEGIFDGGCPGRC